jgi:hypothetical protein
MIFQNVCAQENNSPIEAASQRSNTSARIAWGHTRSRDNGSLQEGWLPAMHDHLYVFECGSGLLDAGDRPTTANSSQHVHLYSRSFPTLE